MHRKLVLYRCAEHKTEANIGIKALEVTKNKWNTQHTFSLHILVSIFIFFHELTQRSIRIEAYKENYYKTGGTLNMHSLSIY